MHHGQKGASRHGTVIKAAPPSKAPAEKPVRLGAFVRFLAVAFVPTIWIGLGWGSWIDLTLLVLFLLMASPPAALLILVVGFLPVVLSVPTAKLLHSLQVGPSSAYVVVTAIVCVALFAARRLLDTHPETYLASPKALGLRRLLLRLSLLVTGLACAATLLRSVPMEKAIAWAVVFGCSAWGLRALVPVRDHVRSSWKVRAGTAAMITVSTVLSLTVVEVGIRLILPPSGNASGIFMEDSRYIFLLKPNGKSTRLIELEDNKTKSVVMATSSQGIRDREVPPKQPGEFRVAMLGDSFTMGYSVPVQYAIPQLLGVRMDALMPERRLRVLNVGIAGAGPLQELGMLRERAFPLEPDLVILQVLPNNDIENALEPLQKRQRAYDLRWHQALASHRARLLYRMRLEKWMFNHSRAYQALRMTTGTQCISDFLGDFRFATVAEKLPPSEKRPFWLEVDLKHWYPELKEGLERLEDGVRTLRDECHARGIDFIAYCMPSSPDISEELWTQQTTAVVPPTEYEYLKAVNLIETFFEEEGIPHFSVLEPLRAAGPVGEVYFINDGHLTEMGNAVVADVVADYLTTQYFPNKANSPLASVDSGRP